MFLSPEKKINKIINLIKKIFDSFYVNKEIIK